ncbi:hydrolase-like protein [Halorubrum distributum JCM 9100]|uniref:Hydrolase-like protein n=2 Tax=Halorubrum distributum TaxID=29283 RepID=M0EPH6_9EURY|nr:hydrolase-like protein [Halorubrum distributum JCM 9100]ELZ56950.1 hydrolase-like protein [Halorubrum distributum JCM 10118]
MTDRSSDDPTVAVPQVPVEDLAVDANADRLRDRAADLPSGVDLAVFPEYALTGFVADERLREAALSRDVARARLESVAETAGSAVVAGYAERDGDAVYNATAYVPPGGSSEDGGGAFSAYRKRHLWDDEAEWVEPGGDRVIVETPAGSTGLLTCYDLNFVAESAWFAERAVDALVVVGAWPADHVANWRLLVRARARRGQVDRRRGAHGNRGRRAPGGGGDLRGQLHRRPPRRRGRRRARPGTGDADRDPRPRHALRAARSGGGCRRHLKLFFPFSKK